MLGREGKGKEYKGGREGERVVRKERKVGMSRYIIIKIIGRIE